MIGDWWALLLIGWGAVGSMMLALWVLATVRRNASVVDAGWGYGLALLGVLYAILADGGTSHRILIGVLAGITGLKIGTYVLLNRVLGKGEDGRYRTLREKRPSTANRFFFVFFQAQGLLDVALSIPFLATALNPSDGIAALEAIGVLVWGAGTLGETLADRQLATFRDDPANAGKVMSGGLWHYSRHPNYFFQIVTWVGFALVATAAPWGWLGWLSPLLITSSILFVTGIPPTEAQALKSRGEAYREYQRTTSPLIPWPPETLR